ncbi:MFS transporter [Roseateles asaccharophilus]|uniref:MFS family permease n=1 Tax=Roseateles asaccharophilus TaxID=582607 RepID=A0ABU2ABK4_9BURK|nr:MFS transporter [Roseateles asaccharophilus]MDR7334385.1 MFS family permease [Roseateles asaccharophilus]
MNTVTLDSTPTAPAAGVIATLALATLLPSLAVSSANVALPTLASAHGAGVADVQWVVLAYLLATTTLIVGAGRLGDLIGRRRLLLGGIALFTAASALCTLAPTLPLLIAARALQGVGAAAMMALTMAFIGAALPKASAGTAMGLLGTMSAVGTALGPSVGGILIAAFGWPAIFAVNVPLGLLVLAMAWRYLPADRASQPAAGFDLPGTFWLALTLAAYALAMTQHLGLLAVAALGLLGFVRAEARAAAPLVSLQRLREPVLGMSLVMNALVTTVMMTTLVVGPFHLARGLGLSAATVGGLMSIGPAVSAFSGVPAGRLVDRFGAHRAMVLGLALMVSGSPLLALLPAGSALAYVGPLAILTPGYALFQAANNAAVMGGADPAQRGVVSGLLNLSRNLGLVTGASLMAAVFAAWTGPVAAPADVAVGMRHTFGVAAVLLLVALAAWRLGRRQAA